MVEIIYNKQIRLYKEKKKRIRSSVCFHFNFWTKGPLILTFCTCVGPDHSSPGIEGQGHRSRSNFKSQGHWVLVRNVVGGTSILIRRQFSSSVFGRIHWPHSSFIRPSFCRFFSTFHLLNCSKENSYQQSNRGHQTPPLVRRCPTWVSLTNPSYRLVSHWDNAWPARLRRLRHRDLYGNTWCQPHNRKYVTYCSAAIENILARATGNMRRDVAKV